MTTDTDPDTSTVVKTKPVDPSTETKPDPSSLPQPTVEVQFTEQSMSQDEQNEWKFQKLARATGISLLSPHEEAQSKKDADEAEKQRKKDEEAEAKAQADEEKAQAEEAQAAEAKAKTSQTKAASK
jgi:hypothetical protein